MKKRSRWSWTLDTVCFLQSTVGHLSSHLWGRTFRKGILHNCKQMVCAFCESWAVAFYPGCTPKKFSFLFVTWARVRFVLFLLIASDRELHVGWNLATRPVTTLTFPHVHICRHDHWRSYLPDNLWDVVHHHGNSFHGCSSLLELVVQELVAQDLQCSSNMLWDEGGPTCVCVCVCICVCVCVCVCACVRVWRSRECVLHDHC